MTSTTPKVSVVMITYNHEAYIEQAIQSILAQNCDFDVELIISNDKSTDETDTVVKRLINNSIVPEHISIKYHHHQQNKGMMGNFIWTLNQASGKYIALCEGDDYWTDPLKLQKQVDFMEAHPDYALCGCLAKRVYEDQTVEDDFEGEAGVFDQIDIAERNMIPTASVLFRSSCIKHLPKWLWDCPVGDWPLYLICTNYGKIKIFDEPMVLRRIHKDGIWGANINSDSAIKNVLRSYKLFAILKDKFNDDVNDKLRDNYLKSLMKLVGLHLKKQEYTEVERFLLILLNEGYNLPQVAEQLSGALTKSLMHQSKEIDYLKTLNTQLTNSNSYRIGRKITGYLKFLKK